MGRTGTFVALGMTVLVGVLSGISIWASLGDAPRAVEVMYDRVAKFVTGRDPLTRCWAPAELPTKPNDLYYYVNGDLDRSCYLAPRNFSGIYIAEFEGDAFIENQKPAEQYSYSVCDAPWLYFDDETQGMNFIDVANPQGRNQIWHIRFIGRPSPELSFIGLYNRYGHLGASQHGIMVDKILEARLLRTYKGYSGMDEGAFVQAELPSSCDSPH